MLLLAALTHHRNSAKPAAAPGNGLGTRNCRLRRGFLFPRHRNQLGRQLSPVGWWPSINAWRF